MKNTLPYRTIYFFRHGEGMDDVRNEFGGWSDPSLSPKGRDLAKRIANKFQLDNKEFSIILTSPLKRASESAYEISNILDIPVETDVYLKERNTYGILGGLSRKLANERYPELLKAYNAQEFIPGAERYEDFKKRMDTLLSRLLELPYESILCVTHGYVITTIMEEFLGLNREEIKDGSYIGLKVVENKFEFLEASGISFSEGKKTYDSNRYRKFK
jgi:broad specificity phosphatase PhoE